MRSTVIRPSAGEQRSPEEIYGHYLIERELADRLRRSATAERGELYSIVYDELFTRVPNHPQLTRVSTPATVEQVVRDKMRLLSNFLAPELTFLELGAGDCRLTLEACRHAR